MRLITEELRRFIGGQVEVQNQEEDYLFRGELESAEVTGGTLLKIKFKWVGRADGWTLHPDHRWFKDTELDYSCHLGIYAAREIKQSGEESNRLVLESPTNGEVIIFYPSDDSNKLDPAKIEKLERV